MVRACAVAGIKAEAPFPHMQYKDVIRKYGSDKPDLRFGMELHEVTDCFPTEAKEKLQIQWRYSGVAREDGAERGMGTRPSLAIGFKMKSAGAFQFSGGETKRALLGNGNAPYIHQNRGSIHFGCCKSATHWLCVVLLNFHYFQ